MRIEGGGQNGCVVYERLHGCARIVMHGPKKRQSKSCCKCFVELFFGISRSMLVNTAWKSMQKAFVQRFLVFFPQLWLFEKTAYIKLFTKSC